MHQRVPFNDTVLKDYHLTSTDIEKFVKLWQEYQMKNMTPQVDECQGYCQGEIYNWLRAYNSIHGYVSLMVSNTRDYNSPWARNPQCWPKQRNRLTNDEQGKPRRYTQTFADRPLMNVGDFFTFELLPKSSFFRIKVIACAQLNHQNHK